MCEVMMFDGNDFFSYFEEKVENSYITCQWKAGSLKGPSDLP